MTRKTSPFRGMRRCRTSPDPITATPARSLLLGVLLALTASHSGCVDVGDLAPEFDLPVLAGDSTRSLSSGRGKIRYVDFWASWCPPCRVSMAETDTLVEELDAERFEVIGISVDERAADAETFLEHHRVNYTNLSDAKGATAEAYALPGMPTSFVVDAEGRVTMVHVGFRRGDMRAIRAHIVELLARHAKTAR